MTIVIFFMGEHFLLLKLLLTNFEGNIMLIGVPRERLDSESRGSDAEDGSANFKTRF